MRMDTNLLEGALARLITAEQKRGAAGKEEVPLPRPQL